MSRYDYDDGRSDYSSTRYYDDRHHTRDRDSREPRYADREVVTKSHTTSRDLVPRSREDSDLSVEEIRREFPPPTYTRDVYREYVDDRSSRYSRDRGYDRDRGHDRGYDRREKRSRDYNDEEKKRHRVLSNQEKIIAAVIGGALAVGGKELYDRREAKTEGHNIQRNALSSAALGAAGAFAAYQGADFYNKRAEKDDRKALVAHKGRDGYSDDESDEDPREKKGNKNFLESALAAAGLGGAVSALTGKSSHDDKHSDSRSHDSRSRAGSPSGGKSKVANKVQKAAMASLIAGATEAFRVAKEPGSWKGEKAKRVLTVAAGAATVDAAQDEKHGKLGIAESVIGGLLGNRLVNGSRRNIEEDKRTGRSRSRSRARSDGGGGGGVSGLAALATAGLGALGAKKFYDNHEEDRSRRRSADSRDGSPDRRRSRSRSVVDTARRGLARLGIGNEPEDSDRSRDTSPRRKSGSSRKQRYRDSSADSYDDYHSDRRRGDRDRDRDRSRDRGYDRDRDRDRDRGSTRGVRDDYDDRSSNRRRGGGSSRNKGGSSDSESDLGSSSGDEKKAKKMKGKQIITTGLAAVATIHAAHNVYQSMEKRRSRQKAVREGRLSAEEANKLKKKALLQDAASVGIAALGIKGAISEMKEVREVNHEMKEWREEKSRRHERRIERQLKARMANNNNNDGDRSRRGSQFDDGPQYNDGNPYGALPAPPMGGRYDKDDRDRDYRD
ncbi:hypothetical protein SBRCBS47491_009473 [Sporothrix bragantina]|uniref:DUF3824 domain-containing protein n=1 Tax=Sporothrix bragantina TaxID=671064 RepID=A0ABP0CV87_9PEZI